MNESVSGGPKTDLKRSALEEEIRELPGPKPIHLRVKTAAVGGLGGVGLGKALTAILVSTGLIDASTAETLAPILDLVGGLLGSFLGGWLPSV